MTNIVNIFNDNVENTNNGNEVLDFIRDCFDVYGTMIVPQEHEENELTNALRVVAKEIMRNSEPEVAQFAEFEPAVEMMGQSLGYCLSKLTIKPIKAPNGQIIGLGSVDIK